MNENEFEIRRATLDDLKQLCALGQTLNIPEPEIVRHLTDFQIAIANDGSMLGAIALEVSGLHGRIHSEVFSDFGSAEALRECIWHRFESVCRSRGLVRLWTQETAPFWKRNGFSAPPHLELLSAIPESWKSKNHPWITLKLRDEELIKQALEKEFIRLKQKEVADDKGLGSIKTIKYTAIGISIVVAIVAISFCVILLRYFPTLIQRLHPG